MAWLERRPAKTAPHGQTFRVCDIDRTRREHVVRSGFVSKREAQALVDRINGDRARGKRANLERCVTFAEYFAELMTRPDLSPTTRPGYEGHYRLYLEPSFGSMLLGDSRGSVKAFIGQMVAAGVGPPMVAHVHRRLRTVLQWATDDELIAANPASRIKLPKAARREPRFLDERELGFSADAIEPQFRTLPALAFPMRGLKHRDGVPAAVRRHRVRPCAVRFLAKTHEAPSADVVQCSRHAATVTPC